jgi:MYXO-CTERM domain-containing protein
VWPSAADFAALLYNATWNNAGFTVYVLGDGSGNVNGQVMLLTVAVPEPSTYALGLAAAGLFGLAQWSRRRR